MVCRLQYESTAKLLSRTWTHFYIIIRTKFQYNTHIHNFIIVFRTKLYYTIYSKLANRHHLPYCPSIRIVHPYCIHHATEFINTEKSQSHQTVKIQHLTKCLIVVMTVQKYKNKKQPPTQNERNQNKYVEPKSRHFRPGNVCRNHTGTLITYKYSF